MDMQTAFNTMVQHLRTQGAPSVTESFPKLCRYRADDSIRRCAVGVLIPDSEYAPEFEGQSAHGLRHLPSLEGLFVRSVVKAGCSRTFLVTMQTLHDSVVDICGKLDPNFLDMWEKGFAEIAKDFGLTVPEHPCKQITAVKQEEAIFV